MEPIDGFNLRVSGREIHDEALRRVEYHQKRLAKYQEMTDVVDLTDDDEFEDIQRQYGSNAPAQLVSNKIDSHKQRLAWWDFVAEHVRPEDEYLLHSGDISSIFGFKGVW